MKLTGMPSWGLALVTVLLGVHNQLGAQQSVTGDWEMLLDSTNSGFSAPSDNATHSILLKTKEVLFINNTGGVLLFDPDPLTNPNYEVDSVTSPVNPDTGQTINLHCSGHCQLSDGRVFFAGGGGSYEFAHAKTVLFNPDTLTWQIKEDMVQRESAGTQLVSR